MAKTKGDHSTQRNRHLRTSFQGGVCFSSFHNFLSTDMHRTYYYRTSRDSDLSLIPGLVKQLTIKLLLDFVYCCCWLWIKLNSHCLLNGDTKCETHNYCLLFFHNCFLVSSQHFWWIGINQWCGELNSKRISFRECNFRKCLWVTCNNSARSKRFKVFHVQLYCSDRYTYQNGPDALSSNCHNTIYPTLWLLYVKLFFKVP